MRLSPIALAVVSSLAFANGNPPPPDPVPQGVNNVNTSNLQSQGQSQNQSQTSSAGASASSSVSTNGNNQVTNYQYARQAPALGQGSIGIVGCGAGINGGGSAPGGAGFLGLAWTPKDCKLLAIADAYLKLGQVSTACEVINKTGLIRELAKKNGFQLPSCAAVAELHSSGNEAFSSPPVSEPRPDLSIYATKQELDSAFKRSQSK